MDCVTRMPCFLAYTWVWSMRSTSRRWQGRQRVRVRYSSPPHTHPFLAGNAVPSFGPFTLPLIPVLGALIPLILSTPLTLVQSFMSSCQEDSLRELLTPLLTHWACLCNGSGKVPGERQGLSCWAILRPSVAFFKFPSPHHLGWFVDV